MTRRAQAAPAVAQRPRLSTEHAGLLAAAAVDLDVAERMGVCSVSTPLDLPAEFAHYGAAATPAIVFPWHAVTGDVQLQLRPDRAIDSGDDRPRKYLFPAGSVPPLAVHPLMQARFADPDTTIVVVEGTKQYLAAVSALRSDPGYAVLGMAGCWGWSHDGGPTPDVQAASWAGRTVLLLLDADVSANPDVFDAARLFADKLTVLYGAREVRFVRLPATGSQGLDDVLAKVAPADRCGAMRRILDTARPALSRRPRRRIHRYLGEEGLLVRSLADEIERDTPLAVGRDGDLCVYKDGYYQPGVVHVQAEVVKKLDQAYRPAHVKAVTEFLTARLTERGRVIPERATEALLNVENGLLDPYSGVLRDHTPDYLSTARLPVVWEPDAQAPNYEAWVSAQAGDQVEDLEETTATMLDPTRTPTKAMLLYGPSRSGKSTYLRLMTALAGRDNTAAVTLHQLATNRFAAARVYGKILDCAADLSAQHVEDLSTFKMLTGEDQITAEHKFMQPFTFTNQALFAFSANEVPSVGETSRAYLERVKPFAFTASYAGAEDPRVEQRLLAELPGILVRWVAALRRLRARGGPLPTNAVVAADFAQRSDRVRLFLAETTVPDEDGVPRRELYSAFKLWADANDSARMGRNKFYERVRLAGVEEYNDRQRGRRFRVRAIDPERSRPHTPDPASAASTRDGSGTAVPGRGVAEPDREGRGGRGGSSVTTSPRATQGVSPEKGHASEREAETATPATVTAPAAPGTVVFDLETGDADALFTYTPRDAQGYVRLAARGDRVDTDTPALLAELDAATEIVGHGILGFDLQALARHHGADYRALAAKARDTLVLARLADPPLSRVGGDKSTRRYGLDTLGRDKLGLGKLPDLGSLARRHGGHDRIPLDDPDYHAYAHRDVTVTAGLAAHYPMTTYGAREHRVLAIAGQMRLIGFRVHTDELHRRLDTQHQRREAILQELARHGLPTDRADGNPTVAPHQTRAGKAAIGVGFAAHGVTLDRTEYGLPDLSRAAMDAVIDRVGERHPAGRLAADVRELNGQRHILQQVLDNVVDGRVHPKVDAPQATGRWSITKPGLTTLGKRGGRHVEREVFLPEPGEVILVADLSQVDARAVAAHCQDPGFLDLFGEGRDFHTEVAATILGDPARRETAKGLNHSVNYGVGASKLAAMAGVPLDVADGYLRGMAEQYPQWAQWKRDVVDLAAAGELLDNGFGRLLRVTPDRAWTAGPAAIGQACARDLLMEGLLRMDAAGLTALLRCVVHDEVVLSVPTADYDDVGREVLQCLSFDWAPPGATRAVQVQAELGKRPGGTWGEVYE